MNLSKPVRILMTGAGAPGAAGIIKCLKEEPSNWKIFTCDCNPEASGKYLGDAFFNIPIATDHTFIPELIEICKTNNIDILLPLVTKELYQLSENKNKFKEIGSSIIISDLNYLKLANNKGTLYQFLEQKNIATPEYYIANNYRDFVEGINKLGYPNKKICFKPTIGNGSRGFRIIDDQIDRNELLFNEKAGHAFITLKEANNIFKLNQFPQLLLAEYLPGEEYSVDCIANHGKCVIAIPRTRTKTVGGISVSGTFVYNTSIIEYCKSIIEITGLHGNIGIQVRADQNHQFKILEINPRVQGTIVAAIGAGINLPALAVKQELGADLNINYDTIKWGTKFVRVWKEVYY